MNIEFHGKQIKIIYWPDTENESGRHLKSSDEKLLEMSATYHGDHDEFWIVECTKINDKFVETARHNPKFIESFEWA